ncbi:dipeptidase [Calditrichota bacterium]
MRIIDLHCDTISEIQAGANILAGNSSGHVDIPRLREGSVGLQVFAHFISSVIAKNQAWDKTKEMIELSLQTFEEFNDYFLKVETAAQVQANFNSDKIGVMLAVENGHAIENSLANLEILRLKGVCYLTLTHSKNLDWAASSGEKKCKFEGLTDFGKKVVHAMNEMGMIIDVSHVHESTFWDVAQNSKKPFIASHSNAAELCPIARNLTDNQIKAIANNGGMIGINFFPGFLDHHYYKQLISTCGDLFNRFDEIELKYIDDPVERKKGMQEFYIVLNKRMENIHVGFEKIVDHIEYIINMVGDDFVGFGSDFDGVPTLPGGISGCDGFKEILKLLEHRNFTKKTIEKIAFRNFVRVLNENE